MHTKASRSLSTSESKPTVPKAYPKPAMHPLPGRPLLHMTTPHRLTNHRLTNHRLALEYAYEFSPGILESTQLNDNSGAIVGLK